MPPTLISFMKLLLLGFHSGGGFPGGSEAYDPPSAVGVLASSSCSLARSLAQLGRDCTGKKSEKKQTRSAVIDSESNTINYFILFILINNINMQLSLL